MNKFHILVIILFGFLLMPSNSFACEMNSTKHSSQKEISSKCNKDCCKKDSHSKNNNGCDGKCNHSKCACASSCNTSITVTEWKIDIANCLALPSVKQNFYNSEAHISSGFNSLWLIPKIS